MFSTRRCAAPGCPLPATWDRSTCAGHDPRPEELVREILGSLAAEHELRDASLAGLRLHDLDLRERRIEFCNLSHCSLERVNLSGSRLRYVYFAFASLADCDLTATDIAMCVFAGAQIDRCDFGGSDIIQSNFLGASLADTRFSESDLYSSRFIGARFRDVQMRDCNLKEVHFDRPPGVEPGGAPADHIGALGFDARASNAREAVYGGER